MSDQPSITCPVCEMTSYHPKDIEMGWCGNCHAYTQDGADGVPSVDRIEMDPNFLDRPTSADFYQMAAQVKILDRQADMAREDNGGEYVIMTENIDPYAIAYMSQQRVIRARQMVPEPKDGNTTGREAVIWTDGFVIGKRYAEAIARGEVVNTPADGNRRQRRGRRR
jgi:hypothetical protein